MSVQRESTRGQSEAQQRLKVTPVPPQTLCLSSLPHFSLSGIPSPSLIGELNPGRPVDTSGERKVSNVGDPNMAPMEAREVPKPLTVPLSFPGSPSIPSLRTDPVQQVPALSWKRPSRYHLRFTEKTGAQRKKVGSPWP